MSKDRKFIILLILSIICLIGTISTNIQQYKQYNQVQEYFEKEDRLREKVEDMELLYEAGIIENKPSVEFGHKYNRTIDTPYNCLNIPISIIFWILAFINFTTLILIFFSNLKCSKGDSIKLKTISLVALLSTLFGIFYWAVNFHS